MKKLRIGVIGAGSIADNHILAYKALDNVELYAICDINEKRAKAKMHQFGFKYSYTSYKEMLKLKEIDAVSICLVNSMHALVSIEALNTGKHVLCEKPMALNSKEAEEMKSAAQKSGKLLMIGFVRRFGNDVNILRDFIDSGYMGDIYYSKATYLRRNGSPGGWFNCKNLSGGGPVIDLGVHVIDLARFLMGCPYPETVTAVTYDYLKSRPHIKNSNTYLSVDNNKNNIFDVEDFASAMIKFDNGATLFLETSYSLNIKKDVSRIELFGSKAGAKLDPELELYTEQNGFLVDIIPAHETALKFEGLFENQIAHFVCCIENKAECISTADDGIVVMKIIDAIYESAKTRREVIIKS